jgi:NADH-quinone oxidoreductase subunit G
MDTIFIENKPYAIKKGQNLLQACLTLGFNLPYFCWHPALGSVGACRQCAVKEFRDEHDNQGKIVMACMTPAKAGARISIDDPEAAEFRSYIIEWMMENHPHDCPICDEGGECHLQDMTVMTGHTYRRFQGGKRTFRNQNLGPFVNQEMNRCIQCYRCVRFYRDYAGGRDFDAFFLRHHVFFGRAEEGTLESEFSGNLVEVCPTGVFYDKTQKEHYTRKWDLQTAPSICVHCGLGCNTIPGERYGLLRRIRNRYNGQVNGYFLCDRGRFGYEFVNSDQRIRVPMQAVSLEGSTNPASQKLEPITKDEALAHIGRLLSDDKKVIGIGSPRASLEANFALRNLVGPEAFYQGVSESDFRLTKSVLEILRKGPASSPSIREVEQADAVFVIGEDVSNTAPMLGLALRQSVRQQPKKIARDLNIPEWDDAAVRNVIQDQKGPLFLANPAGTRLDDIATKTYHAAPADLARLGFAVAHAIVTRSPAVDDLSKGVLSLAESIAQALKSAERPVIVSGISSGSEAIVQAAANVAWALCESGRPAKLCYCVPESNSLGLSLLGGSSVTEAFGKVQDGAVDTVIILENDLYRRSNAASIEALFNKVGHVIVLDHLIHQTSTRAEVALPAATFAEADGTLVNNEGRAQRYYRVISPASTNDNSVQESWRWLQEMLVASKKSATRPWQNLDDLTASMAEAIPTLKDIRQVAPPASFQIEGQKIPRQPARYSGRTSMLANVTIHEPKPPEDPDSPLGFSMEGFAGQPPAALIPRFWSPGWNSVQSLNKFQEEVGGALRGGDPGRRLIEPTQVKNGSFFQNVPDGFIPRSGEWLVIPMYLIFGSEELSIQSPGIAQLVPTPGLKMNPVDGDANKISDGQEVKLQLRSGQYLLPVKFDDSIPAGTVGLPVGLPGLPAYVDGEQSARISI